jgi:tetratricopeptide (TPR) repeat protein
MPIDLATRAFAIKSAHGLDREGLDRWRALPNPMQTLLVKQCVAKAEHYEPKVARAVLLEVREKLQKTPDAAPVLPLSVNIGLANLARAAGDHGARIEALEQTVAICARLPDRTHLVLAHQELAAALDEAGRRTDVPGAYDAALRVAREVNESALLSAVLRNYALWSDRAGNRERAEKLHREAVHHGASCGDWAVHGRSTTAYGIFLQHAGRNEEARRLLEEALAHLPPGHTDTAAAQAHLNALNQSERCSCDSDGGSTARAIGA